MDEINPQTIDIERYTKPETVDDRIMLEDWYNTKTILESGEPVQTKGIYDVIEAAANTIIADPEEVEVEEKVKRVTAYIIRAFALGALQEKLAAEHGIKFVTPGTESREGDQ